MAKEHISVILLRCSHYLIGKEARGRSRFIREYMHVEGNMLCSVVAPVEILSNFQIKTIILIMT
jgi:hypothetical protein